MKRWLVAVGTVAVSSALSAPASAGLTERFRILNDTNITIQTGCSGNNWNSHGAGSRWFANCPANRYTVRNHKAGKPNLVFEASAQQSYSPAAVNPQGVTGCQHPNVVDIEIFIGPAAWGADMGRQEQCKTPGQVGWPSGGNSIWDTITSWFD